MNILELKNDIVDLTNYSVYGELCLNQVWLSTYKSNTTNKLELVTKFSIRIPSYFTHIDSLRNLTSFINTIKTWTIISWPLFENFFGSRMDDWRKEFEVFTPPHAHTYVMAVKQKQKLDDINHSYDQQSVVSTKIRLKKVKFDKLTVTHFYIDWCLFGVQ